MKKSITAGMTAVICTATMALSGCFINVGGMTYDHAEMYTVGGGSVGEYVSTIEVDWIDGSVEISYGDVDKVTFSETSKETLDEEFQLHYWLQGSILHIKFKQSKFGVTVKGYPKKDLKITLPRDMVLYDLDFEGVDCDVKVDNIEVHDMEISTVDGDINAYLVGTSYDIDVETVGGDVYVESKLAPKGLSFESVGGSLTLGLYEVDSFTFEVEGLGTTFTCDFPTEQKGERYYYGDGGNLYEVETVGGNVTVLDKSTK